MAGRHAKKSNGTAKIWVITAVAVVVIAAGVAAFFLIRSNMTDGGDDETATTQTASAVQETATQPAATNPAEAQTTAEQTQAASDAQQTTEQGVTSEKSETEKVVVPVQEGEEVSYFNATYIPSGVVVDSYTGENTTLREVFGASYSQGVITFNSDGSFTDTVTSSDVNSGSYAVQSGKIIATYTNDKNMEITVTQWNGGAPSEFFINYGGYEVYFQ